MPSQPRLGIPRESAAGSPRPDWISLVEPVGCRRICDFPSKGLHPSCIARHYAEEALEISRELADDHLTVRALSLKALTCHASGDFGAGRAAGERAVALARRIGDPVLLGEALLFYALDGESPSRNRQTLEEAAAVLRESGERSPPVSEPPARMSGPTNCSSRFLTGVLCQQERRVGSRRRAPRIRRPGNDVRLIPLVRPGSNLSG